MAGDGNGQDDAMRGQQPARRVQRTSRALAMLLLGGLAAGNADCAQEREPIDRTRPARLDKHFFLGADLRNAQDNPEFYMNNYVVDSSGSNNLVPVATYDDVDRIRWEVQENVLLARKAYEYVTNSDGRGVRGRTETGLVVAAYRIESHFDVRRAYNPTTGEELNIVEENMVDRPWYEREYMRVDWSTNMVDNPDWQGLFYGSLFGDLSFQPVRYYEQDPRSPNFPNLCEMQAGMVRDESTGQCVRAPNARNHPGGYFDVTSRWLVNPEMSSAFGGSLPTCLIVNFFTGSDVYDCNPQESTIRTSFRRVEDRDFQPLELTRAPYDLVGGPRATRNGYDPNYGTLDNNFHRYAMIHNVWQRSHLRNAQNEPLRCGGRDANRNPVDGNVDADSNGTADQCEMAARAAGIAETQWVGSQCDNVSEMCTLPYRNRPVRPIAYYINVETPADFQDHIETPNPDGTVTYRVPTTDEISGRRFTTGPTEQIINTWNLAVRRAIASAREVECRKIGVAPYGGNRETCHNRFFETGDNALVAQEDGAFLGENPRLDAEGVEAANDAREAVVVCHNPVRADDSTACREVGYRYRLGDIRYSHVSFWPGFSRAPFGGIAHWGYDPLTGEVVSNGAMTMGRSVEFAAGQQRDYIRLIMHEIDPNLDPLSVEDYIGGGPAQQLAQYIRNPGATRLGSQTDRVDANAMEARIAQLGDHNHAAEQIAGSVGHFNNDVQRGVQEYVRLTSNFVPDSNQPSSTALAYRALARRLQNTDLEARMVDQDWLRASHVATGSINYSQEQLMERASPLRNMDPETATEFRDSIIARAERRGFCFQDAGAAPLVGSIDLQGVARWFAEKYRDMAPEVRARRILADLRIESFKGIQLHEVGHSIGLYHVPVSSYDSMNYNPQYWQLRTNMGRAAGSCRPTCVQNAQTGPQCANVRNADANMDNCMGPRYLDPESNEENGVRPLTAGNHHAGVNYFANTSTMEYQWERFGETVGLGQYDVYAMGILYGRVVETFDSNVEGFRTAEEQRRFSPRLRTQLANQDYMYWWDPQLGTPTAGRAAPFSGIHYTDLARQLTVFDPSRCRDATEAEKARYRWRIVDGKICSNLSRDHHALADMDSDSQYYYQTPPAAANPDNLTPSWRVRDGVRDGDTVVRDGDGAVRWAFRVSWDRGVGYPHIQYFDQGADIYEVSRSIARKYDLLYPSQYFRRGQREWAGWNVSGSVSSRMFRLIRGYHWNVARDIALYRSFYNDATFSLVARADSILAPTIAVQPEMFSFFQRVLTMPEPGQYVRASDDATDAEPRENPESRAANIGIFDAIDGSSSRTIPFGIGLVSGRFVGDDFDNGRGGSWDYNAYANREGAGMEKAYAAIMLTDTRPTFSSVTRGLYLDGREFQVNFFTDYPVAFDRLIGGLMSEDWVTVAPYAMPTGPGQEISPQLLNLSADNPTRPTTGNVIYPNFGYRQQLPMVIYAMLFSSLNVDLNTINKMRIFTEGGNEQVGIPEAERARFYNPETGIVYVARRYGPDPGLSGLTGGRVVDRGIASRMIDHANALLTDCFETRGVNADGTPVVVRDMNNRPVNRWTSPQRQARALTAYRNYVGVIDATRNVSNLLGYGLLR
ncbi:MAG: hypothetical protein JNK72_21600 [Myxococcales bacterium]|nr:hypothetical protein [Myxococcales bacterium]